jgi:hypothetical protein
MREGATRCVRPGVAIVVVPMLALGVHASARRPAIAQESPLELSRLTGTVVFDGEPDEEAWQRVPALPLTMYFPVHRGSPQQRTEIRVAYDDDFLYAAGWFYDDDPGGIRINSLYRDRWNGDDALAIYVDPFNDNQSAQWFGITPAGMRFDLLVSGDGATLNDSWDGFWDAKTRVTEAGWFAEVRIPFSTLGFQAPDGVAVMGLTVTRLVSRTGERVTFPDIDPRFEFRQPSKARDVLLRGVRSARPWYVTPYALAGVDRRPVLDAPNARYIGRQDPQREVGLDLRYALSPTLTLDLTANTDFAQVEADDQQINLDRFGLFFPEKRRFFQERSSVFDFATGGGGRLFHSRRIGLTEGQRPVPVLGGARLVGRLGEWDLGLLGMRTDDDSASPIEDFAVARLRRRVLNDYSTAGLMLTARRGGGAANTAVGADAQVRLFGDDYLSAAWAGTYDDRQGDDASAGISLAARSVLHMQWQRRATRGIWYSAGVTRAGAEYDPGIGFLPRRDFTAFNAAVNYFVFADARSRWRRVFPGMVVEGTYRNADGVLESARAAAWLQVETKGGSTGWIEPQLFREDVLQPFRLGGVVDIPVGRYTFENLWLYWQMPAGRRVRANTDLQVGTFFDGFRTQLTLTPTWNVSRRLELGGQYIGNVLRFGIRDQRTEIHLARLRIRTALNAQASGAAFVQFNSTTDRLDANVRLRYNFAEGTDLWLVYNEGLATERANDDPLLPRLPLSQGRTLLVKYTRTFSF